MKLKYKNETMNSQAQIVSRGMRWTPEMMERAKKEHCYYKIGEKPGKLYLSGAGARWKKPEHSRYIYIPSLRIAGNPEDLKSLLQSINATDKDIKDYFANSYTSSNISVAGRSGGMLEKYEAEVQEYSKFKESQSDVKDTSAGPSVNLTMLHGLVNVIQQAEAVRTVRAKPAPGSGGNGASSASTGAAKRPGRRVPLAQRISNLRQGQVLDVTGMRDDGTGAKIIAQPGIGSGKMGCTLISGIVSSNLDTFRVALQQLNLTADQQQQCLAQWQAARAMSTTPGVTQNAGAARSTRGRKAATKVTTLPSASSTGVSSIPASRTSSVPSIPTLIPGRGAAVPVLGQASPRATVAPTRLAAAAPVPSTAGRIPSLSAARKSPPRTTIPSLSGMNSLPTLPSLTSPRAMGH